MLGAASQAIIFDCTDKCPAARGPSPHNATHTLTPITTAMEAKEITSRIFLSFLYVLWTTGINVGDVAGAIIKSARVARMSEAISGFLFPAVPAFRYTHAGYVFLRNAANEITSSLRGAKLRSNPLCSIQSVDCFASLAMTIPRPPILFL
jgi:hypothetical protein